jgi:hypothetical protein
MIKFSFDDIPNIIMKNLDLKENDISIDEKEINW